MSAPLSPDLPPPNAQNCCAIIIIYFPDTGFLQRLTLWRQVFPHLVIISNGADTEILAELHATVLIQNPYNFGIAQALNQGMNYALTQRFSWVVTFDQDTLIYPYLLQELQTIYPSIDPKPVILGSNYWHTALNKPLIKEDNTLRYVARKTLITSGTLIWTGLLERVGGFREDYFIDSVDHEYALRLRQYGFQLWISTRVLMQQAIGREHTAHRFPMFRIPEHSALRKYYIFRNSLTTVRTYYRTEPLWCLRQLARLSVEFLTLVFCEQNKRSKIAAIGLGMHHAAMGKMGALIPCPEIIQTDDPK